MTEGRDLGGKFARSVVSWAACVAGGGGGGVMMRAIALHANRRAGPAAGSQPAQQQPAALRCVCCAQRLAASQMSVRLPSMGA